MGGPQVICWALVLSAPLTIAVAVITLPSGGVGSDALTLVLAGLVLDEHVPTTAIVCAVLVLGSVVGTQRARVVRR